MIGAIMKKFLLLFNLVFTVSYAQVSLEWENILAGRVAVAFDLSPRSDQIIYTVHDNNFVVSYNAGKNWEKRGSLPDLTHAIVVSEKDTSIILVHAGTSIFKSQNGGYLWDEVLQNVSMNGVTLVEHPTNLDSVFFVDFVSGDLYVSPDFGSSWVIRTQIALTSICTFSINPKKPKIMLAAAALTEIGLAHKK